MREIEIKAPVEDLDRVRQALEKQGLKFSKPIKQYDRIYYTEGTPDNEPGSVWLRIRVENDRRAIFTVKKATSIMLDSIEYETEVSNAETLRDMVLAMGYKPYFEITKTREKAKQGDIEYCLDDVEGLGMFIEAEKLVPESADGKAIRLELWNKLRAVGIKKTSKELPGYDVLLRNRRQKSP